PSSVRRRGARSSQRPSPAISADAVRPSLKRTVSSSALSTTWAAVMISRGLTTQPVPAASPTEVVARMATTPSEARSISCWSLSGAGSLGAGRSDWPQPAASSAAATAAAAGNFVMRSFLPISGEGNALERVVALEVVEQRAQALVLARGDEHGDLG